MAIANAKTRQRREKKIRTVFNSNGNDIEEFHIGSSVIISDVRFGCISFAGNDDAKTYDEIQTGFGSIL